MPTNPQAPGQTRINFQISEEDKANLERLAKASGMKLSAYIRRVLEDAAMLPKIYKTIEYVFVPPRLDDEPLQAVAEEPMGYDLNPPRDPAGDALKARAARPTPPPTAPQPKPPAAAKGKA